MKNFIALSGLPRTGSTLLASILFQNPKIHTEGSSALYRLIYDMEMSFETNSSLWIRGSGRQSLQSQMISQIPHIYYSNTTAQNVFDKNVAWVFPGGVELIEKYIRPNAKIITMIRPVEEIIQSFIRLRKLNNWEGDIESDLRDPQNPLIGLAAFWIQQAQLRNDDKFLFIQYDDLVDHTKDVLKSIYDFCEIEYFKHDLNNIENKNPENDDHWGLVGLHDIRPTISRREY